ncbi:MAG: hypothetical protein DRQ02_12800 [Candidatus Latescibacterota bacterium]|nr:MAG: hypothetical protein DRQ02_12800 [Candidatus Latescibacterota bacterium]
MKRRCLFCLSVFLSVVAGLVMPQEGACTIGKQMTLSELVQKASLIVTGKVESIRSEWNDEHSMIFSYIVISPDSLLKGSASEGKITLRLLGGTVGKITTIVLGNPWFEEGEEVLLFLRPRTKKPSERFFIVVGSAQGKFHIETVRGSKVATRDLSQTDFIGPCKCRLAEGPVPLSELQRLIEGHLKE